MKKYRKTEKKVEKKKKNIWFTEKKRIYLYKSRTFFEVIGIYLMMGVMTCHLNQGGSTEVFYLPLGFTKKRFRKVEDNNR